MQKMLWKLPDHHASLIPVKERGREAWESLGSKDIFQGVYDRRLAISEALSLQEQAFINIPRAVLTSWEVEV